jgi:hypothetical protein
MLEDLALHLKRNSTICALKCSQTTTTVLTYVSTNVHQLSSSSPNETAGPVLEQGHEHPLEVVFYVVVNCTTGLNMGCIQARHFISGA